MSESLADHSRKPSGRRLVAFGVALAVLGPAAYAVQVLNHRLMMPWYLPITAALGALLVAASLRQKRGCWRIAVLVLVLLLAGAETMFLVAARLPPYTGPIAVGRPFPAFTTTRADGSTFTDRDLRGHRATVLVFFRGRW